MKKNKEKLSKKEKRKKSVIFLLKFFLIFSVLHYLIYLIDTDFLQQFITDFASNALNLPSQGLFIYINAQPFFVSKSCTGLISSFILAAIIFLIVSYLNKTQPGSKDNYSKESPVEILKRRYASGEISREQFEQMMRDITK